MAEPIFDRSDIGRRNYEEGHAFEQRVAELYRLQGYEVEHGRLFSGRQVDLFISRRLGDYSLQRAIECKAGRVRAEDLDSFYSKLRAVSAEYPRVDGTIVSNDGFSDAIASQAHALGVQLTLFRDLSASLFDGHKYAHWLVNECESNSRYPMSLYVEPTIGYEPGGTPSPALEIVSEWLRDPEWNQFTLLGDVGTGKSFLSRVIAYQLAKRFQRRPLENPLPILVDLRSADRQFSLEGLILTHLAHSGVSGVSFDAFQFAVTQGHVVLIFDGFDEMAALVTPQVTLRNFHELARSVRGQAKVLLTCRTHYFKSRTEEEEVILGRASAYESENARELFWDLIARRGFRMGYLQPFERSQIEAYVKQVKGSDGPAAVEKIRRTYNLMELSHRPMLLEMIVRSLDKLGEGEINAATLYQVYTDAWIHRDQWRDVLSPEAKLSLVTAIALNLWAEERTSIHYTELEGCLRSELAGRIQDPREFIEIDHEIRTASFLTRNDSGNYGFAHKSYLEFFVARHISSALTAGNIDCLRGRRLAREIVWFMRDMVQLSVVEEHLEKVLLGPYVSSISENALICLYEFRRAQALGARVEGSEAGSPPLRVPLPKEINLTGAQLDQVNLEGAVMETAHLRGAYLAQASLTGVSMIGADLFGAVLDGGVFVGAELRSCNFARASLKAGNFGGADLTWSDFTDANLSDAYFLEATLSHVTFDRADLLGALLPDSNGGGVAEYWTVIENLRPWMMRIARVVDPSGRLDPDDAVSEISYQLLQPQQLRAFVAEDELARKNRIFALLRRHASEDRYASRKRVSLEGITPSELALAYEDSYGQSPTATGLNVGGPFSSADERWLNRIYSDKVVEYLEHVLSPETVEILYDRFDRELPVREIAANRGVSPSTVQRHLRRVRQIASEYMRVGGDYALEVKRL